MHARDPRGDSWHGTESSRLVRYRQAAEYLNPRVSGAQTVLTSEVGVFGFYFEGPVIDAVGLCTPASLRFFPPSRDDTFDHEGNYRTEASNFTPTPMVMALRPDYLVNSLVFSRNLLREDSPFLEEYVRQHELPPIWGEPLVIFRRRDARAASAVSGRRANASIVTVSELEGEQVDPFHPELYLDQLPREARQILLAPADRLP